VPAPYKSSIGQHYRHILEHFQCLTRGLRSREINYDAREQNPRLDTEVSFASIATCDVLRAIKNYREETLARPCRVVHGVSCGATHMLRGDLFAPQKINPSTFFTDPAVAIKEVEEGTWLVSFMDYDLGYIDLEEKTLQPLDNPFGPKL
jgi:hypothetical protein